MLFEAFVVDESLMEIKARMARALVPLVAIRLLKALPSRPI
jgi:hypothetical protein